MSSAVSERENMVTEPLRAPELVGQARFAMRLSLVFGLIMLTGKWLAWWLTGSTAILSDATESVIHVVAVAFAGFSLRLSTRPANEQFLYGYERIRFFSAGFEGSMIVLAACAILSAAVLKWIHGLELERLGLGLLFTVAASLVNAGLGYYLLRVGRRTQSIILEANGKHVLTDSWTSFGVVGGLLLVLITGWKPFDPLLAIIVALNILWTGWRLIRRSIGGLMDYGDPKIGYRLRERLDQLSEAEGIEYHGLRYRDTGVRLLVEIHLLFPYDFAIGEAHRLATRLEERLPEFMGREVELVTHLESLEDHSAIHGHPHHSAPHNAFRD